MSYSTVKTKERPGDLDGWDTAAEMKESLLSVIGNPTAKPAEKLKALKLLVELEREY